MSDHITPQPTKEIPLTQGKVAIVDAADYEWLSQRKWQAHWNGRVWYARRCVQLNYVKTGIYMHRAILGVGPGALVDHRDGDGLHNTRDNLRPATKPENGSNGGLRRNNTSGFKGVYWHPDCNKWQAHIQTRGKVIYLGVFATPEEAAHAYDAAARELHGEFARLNFG